MQVNQHAYCQLGEPQVFTPILCYYWPTSMVPVKLYVHGAFSYKHHAHVVFAITCMSFLL